VIVSLTVARAGEQRLEASWTGPAAGRIEFSPAAFQLYQRGDAGAETSDPLGQNLRAADQVVLAICQALGVVPREPSGDDDRLAREASFHDAWAEDQPIERVMVREAFEAPTAPEHRFIMGLLGDLKGRRVLDLGCGLGEAAVYFALQGAQVTACDLSPKMLEKASAVAVFFGTSLTIQCATSEGTGLPAGAFDVVYAGNLLHHVDVTRTLDEIRRVLAPGGLLVSWDPLAHNPVIGVYRRLAASVRTPDEHPLRLKDLDAFRQRFLGVQYRTFWFMTLLVFLRFFFWERVHPSKERYWKKILTDAERLAPFYLALERLDRRLLAWLPFLRRYCWNIVVWGRK
jgi:SAM-dependent methyltransferase